MKLFNGQGYINLVDTIPHDVPEGFNSKDAYVVLSAKMCTQNETKADEIDKFIYTLFKRGHFSPFEQVTLTFDIKAPLVVFWQMDRHRTFRYSRQMRRSGRYTEFSSEDFYIPNYFTKENGSDLTGMLEASIEQSLVRYRYALEHGANKESARFFLPGFLCMYTNRFNVDLKNLMHFLKLRNSLHAQREIREVAKAMWELTSSEFPISMKYAEKMESPLNHVI